MNDGESFEETIWAILGLEKDWDSYGAPPIQQAALATAWDLALKLPHKYRAIVPSVHAGIQMEWYTPRAEFEFVIRRDGVIEDYLVEYRLKNEIEYEEEGEGLTDKDFIRIFRGMEIANEMRNYEWGENDYEDDRLTALYAEFDSYVIKS